MTRRSFIGYPFDRMLAAFHDPVEAAAAAAAVRALGIPDRDIAILRGTEGADRLDGSGARPMGCRRASDERSTSR